MKLMDFGHIEHVSMELPLKLYFLEDVEIKKPVDPGGFGGFCKFQRGKVLSPPDFAGYKGDDLTIELYPKNKFLNSRSGGVIKLQDAFGPKVLIGQ